MQTRRDQAQAYRFATSRTRLALTGGDPDARESLVRRSAVFTFAGAMLAVLVVAGFGVFGLVKNGHGKGWDAGGVLVVEKETGARFVYDKRDGELHPMLNYTSARLFLNTGNVQVHSYSRATLDDVPRGVPYGEPNLPDALPTADDLVTGPFVACSGGSAGKDVTPFFTVAAGTTPTGTPLGGGRGVLVRSVDPERGEQVWLLLGGRRLRIADSLDALVALNWKGVTPLTVATEWLNTVPAGPDLRAPALSGVGKPAGYAVGSTPTRIGTVFYAPAAGPGQDLQYYVAVKDHLSPLGEVAQRLLLIDRSVQRLVYGNNAARPLKATPSRLVQKGIKVGDQARVPAGYPSALPQLAHPDQQLSAPVFCSTPTNGGTSTAVTVRVREATPAELARPTGAPPLILPPGTAALVRPVTTDGRPGASRFLLADTGFRYPVPDDATAAALGYGGVGAVDLPAGFTAPVQEGPTLDQRAAGGDAAAGG